MSYSKWAGVAVVVFVIFTSVVAVAGEDPETFTGCLTPGGDLSNIAAGELPAKECKGNSIPLSFSAGDITAVFAGEGLVGGATVGDAQLSLDFDLLDGSYVNEGDAVSWSLLSGVPFGLDDGDDDTTYAAGSGLSLVGDTFSVDFAGSGTESTSARSDHRHDGIYAPLDHDHEPQASNRVVEFATLSAAPHGPGIVEVWFHFDTDPIPIGPGFPQWEIDVCFWGGIPSGGSTFECLPAQLATGLPGSGATNVVYFDVGGWADHVYFRFNLASFGMLGYAEGNNITYVGQDANGFVTIPVVLTDAGW
jgi:hypothetical protein